MRLEHLDRAPAKGQPAVGLRVQDGDDKKGGEIGHDGRQPMTQNPVQPGLGPMAVP
jgi:hypothetical protein